jgi:replicative DNA helicase
MASHPTPDQRLAASARRAATADLIGHLPPHDLRLEQAILGAMMLESAALPSVLSIMATEQVFYHAAHQFIFKAMRALFDNGRPVDQLTVVAQLREMGVLERVGGPFFVANLTLKVNSAANVEYHARLVQQFHARREIIATLTRVLQQAYDNTQDELDLLTEAQTRLIALHGTLDTRAVVTGTAAYDLTFRKLRHAMNHQGRTGVDCGLKELTLATNGGWQPSDLIVLAARPGMGKTAAMLQFARACALDQGDACAIFSLEMPIVQLMERLIVSETGTYTNADLRAGRLFSEEAFNRLYQDAKRLHTDKLLLDDTSGLSIQQLRAKAVRLKAEHDIKLILVDYIQLMKGDQRGNREQEIGSITRGLKELAKELNVPVIALSQLSRSVENRGGEKRPQLSDLRESGSIEQDADAVVFLWRAEYYKITQDADGNSTADTILFDFAKHRNGAQGEIITGCKISQGRFFDLDATPGFGDVQVGPAQIGGPLPQSTFDEETDLPF